MKILIKISIGLFFITLLQNCEIKKEQIIKVNTPLDYAKLIADRSINETYFGLIDFNTGEKYDDFNNLPDSARFTLNPYVRWVYMNGVLGLAMLDLADYTNDKSYVTYLSKVMDFRLDNYDLFKKLTDDNRRLIWMSSMYNFQSLDAYGAMGAFLVELYRKDNRRWYKEYADSAARVILERPKLADGTIARYEPNDKTVWLDDLYMSVPFLVKYSNLTNNPRFMAIAVKQIVQFNKYLFDPCSGLYYHVYYDNIGKQGSAHWGRANGWSIMAQVELLKSLPEDHPMRDSLLNIFRTEVEGLSRYQSENGLWHQLLDKSDSYLETSGSSMFVYGIAKGINEGWIDDVYKDVAFKGWEGLKTMITETGDVKNICIGTGTSTSLSYYYQRPVLLNDLHGLGSVILAAIEVDKLIKSK
ncbi:MAG: glycoside hydrolase family 88 protein [Chlorobi bacterium]|nr:glycoside hydrolase family 88 protein [Chlorobiota bacterium]